MPLGKVSPNVRRRSAIVSGSYRDGVLRDPRWLAAVAAAACSRVTPGFRRPSRWTVRHALDGCAAAEHVGEVNVRAAPHEPLRHYTDDRPHLAVQPQPRPSTPGRRRTGAARICTEHGDRLRAPAASADVGVRPKTAGRPSRRRCSWCSDCRADVAGRPPVQRDVAPGRRDHAVTRVVFGDLEELIDRVGTSRCRARAPRRGRSRHQRVRVPVRERLQMTAWITLNIVVVAPMPSARERMAAPVKAGLRRSMRSA